MLTTAQYTVNMRTSAGTCHSNMISVTLNDKNVPTLILERIPEHEEMRTHSQTRTHSHTQFIMSVMRCEYNSPMIIICTVTLQRLKIGKWVTAVKPRDSLTGTNMVRGVVCFCVCVRERERERENWMKDKNRVNEDTCALVTFYEEILQTVYILWGIFAIFGVTFTF